MVSLDWTLCHAQWLWSCHTCSVFEPLSRTAAFNHNLRHRARIELRGGGGAPPFLCGVSVCCMNTARMARVSALPCPCLSRDCRQSQSCSELHPRVKPSNLTELVRADDRCASRTSSVMRGRGEVPATSLCCVACERPVHAKVL